MRYILIIFILYWMMPALTAGGPAVDAASYLIPDSQLTIEEALEGLNPQCPESIKRNQALVDVLYTGMNGHVHRGQILVDRRLADDIREVFRVAFKAEFPIQSVIPVSRFNWSDTDSMIANNTSAFNYRPVTGGKRLSNHSYGFAIDINPLLNPYIKGGTVLPPGASYDPTIPGTLTENDIIVQTFLELGWEWGGHWTSLKDYQHFEKVLP